MKLLLLDTCGAQASIALADTTQSPPILAETLLPGRTASERLVSTLRTLLAEQHWKPSSLDAIAVVTGPGSFTGVRIGLAAAKGLAEAQATPLIPISRLTLLAAAAEKIASADPASATAKPADLNLCVLLDAGRNEFYCGRRTANHLLEESLIPLAEAQSLIRTADLTLVCDPTVAERLTLATPNSPIHLIPEPTAADALPLALTLLERGPFDPLELDANYLRRTDAEIFAKPTLSKAP